MMILRQLLPLTILPLSTNAFVVAGPASARYRPLFLSDQWDDEPEEQITSYDDAALGLIKRQEEQDLRGLTDEAVPGSEAEAQERLRAAVQERTKNLGMQEASKEAIAAAAQRAQQRTQTSFGGLDLSKISNDYEKLSINYEPEEEMTEEEMRAADPLSFEKSFPQQLIYELNETTFPNLGATLSKVALLIGLGAITGLLIVGTDRGVRDFYVSQGLLPSAEDIQKAQQAGLKAAQELTKPGTTLPDLDGATPAP